MIKTKKIFCKILSAVVTLGVLFSNVSTPKAANYKEDALNVNVLRDDSTANVSSVSANDYNLPDKVEGGVILHAWCWSAKTIISQLPDIAAAGYTAIQTIPCNGIMHSEGEGVDKWWTQYQPTKLEIGNYMIGSKEDFTELCTEAHKYGIKIIVDVVPNHTADYNYANEIDDNLKRYWRGNHRSITDYNNRADCTQNDVCGSLADMNTENKDYQKMYVEYLNKLIACGCDGFRYDTAKHIAVPEDSASGCGSDFWPTVTGSSVTDINKKFVYGEVLQDTNVMFSSYAKYIHLTGNYYSATIRDKLRNGGTMDVNAISSYNSQGASVDRLVVWAESHDTFANNPDDDKYNESSWASQANIRMAWAFIAARKDATCLFYARPKGADGNHNRFPGQNKLGEMGSTEFKAPEVAAVNNFRNAMMGESEDLRNPNGNTKIAMVERGKKGVVIINLGGATDLSSETTLQDGTYKDQVSGRDFTVSGGKITGKLDEYKVAVVYNADNTPSTAAKVSASVSSGSSFTDSLKVTLNAKNTTSAKYSVDGGSEESYTDGESITIGKNTKIGGKVTLKLTGKGESGDVTETYTYIKKDPNAIDVAYLKKPSSWGNAYIYIYDDDKTITDDSKVKKNAEWPGLPMTKVEGEDDLYKCEIPSDYKNARVIFTNGEKSGTLKYPADTETEVDAAGLTVDGSWIYDGTSWKEYTNASSGGNDEEEEEDIKAGKISFSVASPQEAGTSIKITTAAATGGSGDYSYQFECDEEVLQKYDTSKTVTWNPDKEGSYTIKVIVKDSKGNTDSKTATYKITSKQGESDQDEKEYTITVKYIDKDTGKAIRSEEKITGKEGESFKIEKKTINGYTFKSYIGDLSGTFSEDATVTLKYVKEVPSDDNNDEGIVIDSFKATTSKTNIETGDSVTFNVSASGGLGTLKYALMCNKDGEVETIKNYSTKTSFTWTPEEEGTYKLYVMVKDDNDKPIRSKKIVYTVKDKQTGQDSTETSGTSNLGLIISMLAVAGISMKKLKK